MKMPSQPPIARRLPVWRSSAAGALAGLVLALVTLPAGAADPAPPLNLEPVPDGAPGLRGNEPPDISIRHDNTGEFKEYRVRGQLYAVKVTPLVGKPYWLIDRDGQLQRYDGPSPKLTVPSWLILEW